MAGNRRNQLGGGSVVPLRSAQSSLGDDEEERTAIEDGPPPQPPRGWREEKTAAEGPNRAAGKARDDDDEADTYSATVDEYTIEESASGLQASGRKRGSQGAANQGAKGTLNVVGGNDKGKSFQLTGRRLSIGRGIDNDIVLSDLAVSRQHLALDFTDGRYHVRDLGSGNGTLINDIEERGRITVFDGDRIELGNTIIHCELPHHKRVGGETMDIDEDDSSLIPLPDGPDHVSTFSGKRDARRLVGAGVAKARAQRSRPNQSRPGAAAARVTEPRSARPPPGARRSSAGGPFQGRAMAPAVKTPHPPEPNILDKLPSPGAGRGPGAAADPLGTLDNPSQPPQNRPPVHGGFGSVPSGGGFGAPPSGPPSGLGGPRSSPASGFGASPSGLAWADSDDALPIPTAPPSQASRLPGIPPGYSDDRLPVARRGMHSGQMGADAIPKLAHMQGSPRHDRRKLAVAVLGGLAALIVVAGVSLAALGDGEGDSSATKELASAASGESADSAAGERKGDDQGDAEEAAGEERAAKGSGDDSARSETSDETRGEKKQADAEPTLVASLPATTWGTEEAALRAGFTFVEPKPAEPVKESGDEGAEEDAAAEDEQPAAADEKEEPRAKPKRRRNDAAAERRAAKERAAAQRRAEAKRRAAQRRARQRKPTRARSSGSSDRDRARAEALYKRKDFSAAAALARKASSQSSGSERKKLAALAKYYGMVGAQLRKGDSAGDPTAAASAYGVALRADRRAGGAHQGLLRLKLKIKAPKAAKAYMARRNFSGARKMAALASSVGAGSQVRSILSSLERKAQQVVKAGDRLAQKGNKAAARKKYRQAQNMVPRSSSSYRAAAAGLRRL